jgi:predicted DNA-binding transcriptional regulator YafY
MAVASSIEARWVLSWMPDVEVLAPRSLRDRVREKLREALGSPATCQ